MKYGLCLVLSCVFLAASCAPTLTPELIRELAKDSASFCAEADVRGGVGTLMSPSGGYGQGTLRFCRSNQKDARVKITPDGVSIEHGTGVE